MVLITVRAISQCLPMVSLDRKDLRIEIRISLIYV